MDRHVILTLGRSGSNTLANLLNQHPDVLNVGEVLGEWTRVRQVRDKLGIYRGGYLDALTRRSALIRTMVGVRNAGRLARGKTAEIKPLSRVKSLGFKEFATHMEPHRDWLRGTDAKVIGLVRDDPLDRLVSWLMLENTGVVASTGDGNARAIRIDPDRIASLLTRIEAENALLRSMLEELPEERVHVLRYEDFYRDARAQMGEVFRFLGVRPVDVETQMRKIIRAPAADMIANRRECAEALQGTPHEGALA